MLKYVGPRQHSILSIVRKIFDTKAGKFPHSLMNRFKWYILSSVAAATALTACEPDRADVFMNVLDDGTVALACERSGTIPDVASDLVTTRVENLAASVCRGEAEFEDRRVVYEMLDSIRSS